MAGDHDLNHAESAGFTVRTYVSGFLIASALTAIPFWIVMSGSIANRAVAGTAIAVLAAIQILVHTFAFLHVNAKAQGGWTLVAYVFTAVLVIITIGGSLWIMQHLNLNMMPGMMDGAIDRGM